MDLRDELLAVVPDAPRWIEARAILLSGRCRVIGPPGGCYVRDTEVPVAALVGRPAPELLREATGAEPGYIDLVLQDEQLDLVAEALPGWITEPVYMHRLAAGSTGWRDEDTSGVRLLEKDEDGLLAPLPPPDWEDSMRSALRHAHVAARFVDGEAVSFASVNFETESFWDVAIVTLDGHRKRGHAAATAAFLIQMMMARGREPVWGATRKNTGSLRLAARLGFERVEQCHIAARRDLVEALEKGA